MRQATHSPLRSQWDEHHGTTPLVIASQHRASTLSGDAFQSHTPHRKKQASGPGTTPHRIGTERSRSNQPSVANRISLRRNAPACQRTQRTNGCRTPDMRRFTLLRPGARLTQPEPRDRSFGAGLDPAMKVPAGCSNQGPRRRGTCSRDATDRGKPRTKSLDRQRYPQQCPREPTA